MAKSINLSDNNINNDVSFEVHSGAPSTTPATLGINPQKEGWKSRLKDKKLKPKASKKKKAISLFILIFLIAAPITYFALKFTSETKKTLNQIGFNATPINPFKEPELKRDSTDKLTNALIVGIDTRENNHGLQNTDTIIVASYNHETKESLMISIPRDTYIPDPYYEKINGVYFIAEQNEEGSGMEALKTVAEEYTGLEIQYWGLVDLQGFKKIVDTIGGVEVNVEVPFIDYEYPDEETLGYQTVSFEAGPQTMDGVTALQYARSRKGNNGEGSDFKRARRQQKVINAVKEKILTSETLLSPSKVLEIISAIQENIKLSEFTTEDIQAGINLLKDANDIQTRSFVLDPNLIALNRVIVTGQGEGYTIIPKLGPGKYEEVHEVVQTILSDPKLYEENPLILVYNTGLGNAAASAKVLELQEKYPYLNIVYQGTLYSDQIGTYVYTYEEGKAPRAVEVLSKEFDKSEKNKPDFITNALNGEDLTILLGASQSTNSTDVTIE